MPNKACQCYTSVKFLSGGDGPMNAGYSAACLLYMSEYVALDSSPIDFPYEIRIDVGMGDEPLNGIYVIFKSNNIRLKEDLVNVRCDKISDIELAKVYNLFGWLFTTAPYKLHISNSLQEIDNKRNRVHISGEKNDFDLTIVFSNKSTLDFTLSKILDTLFIAAMDPVMYVR